MSKYYSDNNENVVAESLPGPVWKKFMLVRKNGKRRAEVESETSGETAYRLFDGDSVYGLNPGDLNIVPSDNLEKRWADLTSFVSDVECVHYGTSIGPVQVAMKSHIDELQKPEGEGYFNETNSVLKIYSDNGLTVIELTPKDYEGGLRSTFWLDPKRGFNVVKSIYELGQPGTASYHFSKKSVSYQEIAPGVYVMLKGSSFVGATGTVAVNQRRAGWGRRDVEIDNIEFGDFEYDEGLFEVESLPVKEGSHVLDLRQRPPLEFQYGKAPLDEQVLAVAAENAPLAYQYEHRWRWPLIGVNITVIVFVACVIWLRRQATKKV